jgi:4-hydroxy-tetrahydrodipicolinate synthase
VAQCIPEILETEKFMPAPIAGLFAAPPTPLDPHGGIDLDAFERLLDFLLERGVEGICVGGATSEYPQFDLEERKALISRAARKTQGRAVLLASVGACSIMRVLDLARHALREGASALLLPAPHFFPCAQSDLEAFCHEVSRALPAPYLLYNLPGFTTGFEIATSLRLLQGSKEFVGIKDSSGNLAAIETLAAARGSRDQSLLVGSDELLLQSLSAGWNGVISGTACVCPELYVCLFRKFRAGDFQSAQQCQALVDELGRQVMSIPFPWGIRIGVEVRGISTGPLPLPVSPFREHQINSFRSQFPLWLKEKLGEMVLEVR